MFDSSTSHWFPLSNPGIVSIPLGFLLGWLGTVISKEPDERRYAELEVRALTGAGAEKAVVPLSAELSSSSHPRSRGPHLGRIAAPGFGARPGGQTSGHARSPRAHHSPRTTRRAPVAGYGSFSTLVTDAKREALIAEMTCNGWDFKDERVFEKKTELRRVLQLRRR